MGSQRFASGLSFFPGAMIGRREPIGTMETPRWLWLHTIVPDAVALEPRTWTRLARAGTMQIFVKVSYYDVCLD